MNIQTVRDRLKNTIRNKELYLNSLDTNSTVGSMSATYVKINLDELYNILGDIEACVQKDIDDSWRLNPEQMGR